MQAIKAYFPAISKIQEQRFDKLSELYLYWNQRVNVVSRKDIEHLEVRHVLHSLAIGKYISFPDGSKILDVGTGGGFPGIPLAILFPQAKFHLVDSIGKKIKVVKHIIDSLELTNCTAEQVRAEDLDKGYHYIVSRAVTRFPVFYKWVSKLIIQNNSFPYKGIIYLKGGDLTEELKPFAGRVKEILIPDYFDDEFFESKKIIHLLF